MKLESLFPYKSNRFLLKFVTSYSIILLFILVMGSFFYYAAISNSEDSIHKQNIALLETNVGDINDSLRLFSTLAKQISASSEVKQLLYHNEFEKKDGKFYILAKSAMNYLTNIMSIEETLPISNYYVYFPNIDYFLSSTTFSDAERFYLYNKQYARQSYEEWHTMVTSYSNMQQFISLTQYKDNLNLYVYKQLICPNLAGSALPGILYIEINGEDLVQTFSTLSLDSDCSLYAINQDNLSMFTLTNGSDLSYDPQKIIQSLPQENDESIFYTPKKDYLITKATSQYNKWTYYLIEPASFLLKDFYIIQRFYQGMILLTCLFTMVIIFLMSMQNVKPLMQMNDELESSKAENESLHNTLELQKPYVYNAYMNRIMKGRIVSTNDLEKIASYLNIGIEDRSYAVLYVKVQLSDSSIPVESTLDSDNTQITELNHELNILADHADYIVKALKQYFGQECYIYKADLHIYAVLLAYPDTISSSEFAKECKSRFIKLHEELSKEYHINIYAGFGKKNARLTYVWESYQQAKEAAGYVRKDNIFQSYNDIKRENTNYYYPLELANQLTNFIQHNNSRQITEIFKILRRENFEYRTLPTDILKGLIADLKNTLVKTKASISEADIPAVLLNRIEVATEQAITFEDAEKLAQLYCSLYEKPVEKNPLIISIEDYINQNYADASMSLKKISNEFSISESYFSTLFKAETQQNFSDYLEQIRMEHAMYLIKTTDTNLSDIFMAVGYNNANSFRRAFKKIYGVSPRTVRDSAK